ncbi:MAG TPA: pectinesterase family protein [Terracidiphilus sp.]|nr:pectinesterase family protein [Terracidiphilus sp.]
MSLRNCRPAAAGWLALACLQMVCGAQDVHVRVSHDVKTGVEGTTAFPTIQMAMDHHPFAGIGPDGRPGRVFIEIAPGIYHERVIVTQNHANITLVGMGKSPADVVITNSLSAKQAGGTFFTETVEINGDGFEADNLTFENSAGNTGQAVAAAVRADRAVFKHCRFLGHQDTLFADYGRQYYVDSYIEGGVDFIFGNAAAVFDHDEIHSNGTGYLTAQSRTSPRQTTGYVILDSRVTGLEKNTAGKPDAPGNETQSNESPRNENQSRDTISLGRPWRPYSRVVYIHTELPANLISQGWNAWGRMSSDLHAYYAEYRDSGPGANPSARVAWSHQLTAKEAAQYMPREFLAGNDHWNAKADAEKLP